MWKINVVNLIQIKASLAKNFHIQPSEIDRMPMWEYEMFIEEVNRQVQEENKQQQDEMDKQKSQYSQPKMPKYSQPKMPTFKAPKI